MIPLRAWRSCDLDTIKVAKGTYKPTASPGRNPYNSVLSEQTFYLPDSVVILGGYPSGGGNRSIPDNATRLTSTVGADMVKIVRVSNVLIDGVIFDKRGIFASESNFSVKNCVVQDVYQVGSPITLNNCNAEFVNSFFVNNQGSDFTSTFRQIAGTLKYTNLVFAKNINRGFGGSSVWMEQGGYASFDNCTFFGNRTNFGGAIQSNSGAAKIDVLNC